MRQFKVFLLLSILTIPLNGCTSTKNSDSINSSSGSDHVIVSDSSSSDFLHPEYNVYVGDQKDCSVTVKNQTSFDFCELTVSEHGEYKWSQNLISGSDPFNGDSSKSIIFPSIYKNKVYDIRAIDKDEKEYVWENLSIFSVSEVTFSIEDYLPIAKSENTRW